MVMGKFNGAPGSTEAPADLLGAVEPDGVRFRLVMASLVKESSSTSGADECGDAVNEKGERAVESWEHAAVVDVTELCRQAAATLGPNEMIHDADFNLYSAMSALELMDAKMDKAPPALQVRPPCTVVTFVVLSSNYTTTD